ncbi:hypothetical protein G7K_6265-t1 [Saitoella complicata NRRL Y-17804]|uniref:Uncharacterized protein n=1 Tax=Saitoella complicata (strain BCRC 22490 / CBS 7301 / JCM 7358 / NBRC 10748 / NRRL Y-17804) TaxID=698492 RepID=A0A0E9NQM5_SAICN|nr:hypothetical protein G7K_6265-t1 [Saitoella complicata NRRL Y-17804]
MSRKYAYTHKEKLTSTWVPGPRACNFYDVDSKSVAVPIHAYHQLVPSNEYGNNLYNRTHAGLGKLRVGLCCTFSAVTKP